MLCLEYVNYEERKPCMLCLDEAEDVLNSRIGSKTLGVAPGKIKHHDDECLLWVSEKNKELRTVVDYAKK